MSVNSFNKSVIDYNTALEACREVDSVVHIASGVRLFPNEKLSHKIITPKMKMPSKNVILVTGGAGFLGQHVVQLLQTTADHVTEIRVLDVVPYKNKLGHKEKFLVKSFTGSVSDYNTVLEACREVDSVMHIASIVDIRLFPNEKLSHDVNVKGTETVIRACKEAGVKRLIYCSTMDVVIGRENIYDGNEENTRLMEDHENLFPVYGPTKVAAEKLALNANSSALRTLALRPAVLYGELDQRYFSPTVKLVRTLGRYIRIDTSAGVVLHAYVGNMAWAFICADKTLMKGDESAIKASGKAYFITDETPKKHMFDFVDSFMIDAGAKPFPFTLPLWLFICMTHILVFILLPLRRVLDVNFSQGLSGFLFLKTIHIFSHSKATQMLNYRPLFTAAQAKARTVEYLKDALQRPHLKAS